MLNWSVAYAAPAVTCALAESCARARAFWVVWSTTRNPNIPTSRLDTSKVIVIIRSWRDRRQVRRTGSASAAARAAAGRHQSRSWRRDWPDPSGRGPSGRGLATVHPAIRSASAGLVPHTPHGQDDLRPLRVWFDLGPQALHVDVHQPGVGRVPVAPHLLQQHLAGEDL